MDLGLTVCVDLTGGLIKDQEGRVLEDGPAITIRWSWPPLSPAPCSPTTVSYPFGRSTMGCWASARWGGLADPFRGGPRSSVGDVVGHRVVEGHQVLGHQPDLIAKARQGDLPEIEAVDEDASGVRIIKTGDQVGQGGLADPFGSDEGDPVAGRDRQVSRPSRPVGLARIGEVDVLKEDPFRGEDMVWHPGRLPL